MLNLLFITRDFTNYVNKSFHYFALELSKRSNLMLWHEKGHIRDILKELPVRPDFVLLNDFRDNECPAVKGLDTLDIPLGAIMHDLHYRPEDRKQFVKQNRIGHLFTIYRDAFLRDYSEFRSRMHWLPHFAHTEVFKDYGSKKDIDILMLGCTVKKYYPLRYRMLRHYTGQPGFVCYEHPGYKDFRSDGKDAGVVIGEKYARTINRAKLFLTCDTIYHYPLRKYYEVAACRTLLLAPHNHELADLGLVPGKHFVAITENDYADKADYYLRHDDKRRRIADEGYRFVRQNHSAAVRAAEFIQTVEAILS